MKGMIVEKKRLLRRSVAQQGLLGSRRETGVENNSLVLFLLGVLSHFVLVVMRSPIRVGSRRVRPDEVQSVLGKEGRTAGACRGR